MARRMAREEAIKILNKYDLNFCDIDGNPIPPQDLAEAFDMAKEALEQEQSEDCISREWVLNKIHDYAEADTTSTEESIGADYCAEFVKDAPSAVPSRPTGKWYIIEYEYFTCDQCGEYVYNGAEYTQEAREMLKNGDFPNYCPNCGARMESGEK